jgi:hypothetical protein
MKRKLFLTLASLAIFASFASAMIAVAEFDITIGPFTFVRTATPAFFFGKATIDGLEVQIGDVVAAFVNRKPGSDVVNDLCIGALEVAKVGWYAPMAAYGDDPDTPQKDGASGGETVKFKIWQQSTDRIAYAIPQGPDDTIWIPGAQLNVELVITGISADSSGVRKDVFSEGEDIYGKALLGLEPNASYDVYIVSDKDNWTDGDSIPSRVPGAADAFTTDGDGHMPAGTLLYSNPAPGSYDIIVDVDKDEKFDQVVDYLDDVSDVGAKSLPVTLASFSADFVEKNTGVVLHWRTAMEINHLGWNIYRSNAIDGKYSVINEKLIPAKDSLDFPRKYSFVDENVEKGKKYFYYLESVDISGGREKSAIISVPTSPPNPKLKLPICWGRLKTR